MNDMGLPGTGRKREIVRRYLPAEIAGTAAALAAGLAFALATGSAAAGAVAATFGESAGYYGVIAFIDFRAGRLSAERPLRTLGNLLLEFAPAEALDTLFVRPTLIFAGMTLAPNPGIGIVAGKLAADLLFYVPTILGREVLRRRGRLSTGGLS
jgi:hypothetical protein